jgi:hypothetical protein
VSTSDPSRFPRDPGDLFAILYDGLNDQDFESTAAEVWPLDDWVQTVRDEVTREVLATGGVEPAWVEVAIRQRGAQGRFAVAWGLDRALDYASPYSGLRADEHLYAIVRRHAETGRVDSGAVPGAVLFGCSFPGRPLTHARRDTVFSLVRVDAAMWATIDLVRIPSETDVILGGTPEWDELLRIAHAPVADASDLEIVPMDDKRPAGYQLRLTDSVDLRERLKRILERLDNVGAHIAVMPEGCLTEDLLRYWQEILSETEPPEHSRLCWLVIGSGPLGGCDPPWNRAVVVDRDGRVLAEQNKLADFTLDRQQAERWHLDHLADQPIRLENIRTDGRRAILESRIGRVCIVICEDLARTIDCGGTVRSVGGSLVLVPVLSGGLGWAINKAFEFVENVGAWVIVANSLAIRVSDPHGNLTFVAAGPERDERDSWHRNLASVDSRLADDISLACIPAARSHRWTDFL